MNNEPIDEEDTDIADDPLLSAVYDELQAASQKTDRRLLIFIGAGLIIALLPKYVRVPAWMVYVFAAASFFCIVGGIVYTIFSTIQKKRVVASAYGLRCGGCGCLPKVGQILQAAELRKCPSCGGALDVHLPSTRGNS